MKVKLTFAWGLFLFFAGAFCVPNVSTIPPEATQAKDIVMMAVVILAMLTGGVFIGKGLKLIIIDAINSAK